MTDTASGEQGQPGPITQLDEHTTQKEYRGFAIVIGIYESKIDPQRYTVVWSVWDLGTCVADGSEVGTDSMLPKLAERANQSAVECIDGVSVVIERRVAAALKEARVGNARRSWA